MADFESKFRYDSDFSKVTADIKKLVREATNANSVFAQLNKTAASVKMEAARSFSAQAGFAGFKTQIVDLTGATEKFGQQLVKNKLTMKEYFKEAAQAYKKDSKARALAEREVRRSRSTVVGMGDINGQRKGMLVTPQALDMSKSANKIAVASKQYEIFNDLVQKGSTAMVNWGKNTQWAGRQLTVGLTVPMGIFTGQALKAFAELDKEVTRFTKVYGTGLKDSVTDSTAAMVDSIKAMGSEFAKQYGIASKETMALAADLAAAGLEGDNLANAVNQTTRMMVLGEVDRQEAMKATLSIQTAFNQSSKELAKSVDFLNAVENTTSASLQDLVESIPKTGPVIQALGGDIKDLSVLMTALREGGISAGEGANALKSGMASLISPTTKAIEVARQFGIDLEGIATKNKGQLMPMLTAFQEQLKGLDDFGKAKLIEEIFGKYQFARMSALFDNLNAQGSQTVGMMKLMKMSADDLAKKSYSELKAQENAPSTRLAAMQQQLQENLIRVGADLAETLLPIMQQALDILQTIIEGFNNLPGPIKTFAKILGGVTAAAGPILMLAGIFGNLIGNAVKFGMSIINMFKRLTGHPVQQLQILSDEELAAKIAANQLTGAYERQRTSVVELNAALELYIANLRTAASIAPPGAVSPGGRGRGPVPPIRRAEGGIIYAQNGVNSAGRINGYGGGDTVPALLEPGEFVINKESSSRYAPLLSDINAGKDVPGYQGGTPKGVGDVYDFDTNGQNEQSLVSMKKKSGSGIRTGTIEHYSKLANGVASFEQGLSKEVSIRFANDLKQFSSWGPEDWKKFTPFDITKLPSALQPMAKAMNTVGEMQKLMAMAIPAGTSAKEMQALMQLDSSHALGGGNAVLVKTKEKIKGLLTGLTIRKQYVGTTLLESSGFNRLFNSMSQKKTPADIAAKIIKSSGMFGQDDAMRIANIVAGTGAPVTAKETMMLKDFFLEMESNTALQKEFNVHKMDKLNFKQMKQSARYFEWLGGLANTDIARYAEIRKEQAALSTFALMNNEARATAFGTTDEIKQFNTLLNSKPYQNIERIILHPGMTDIQKKAAIENVMALSSKKLTGQDFFKESEVEKMRNLTADPVGSTTTKYRDATGRERLLRIAGQPLFSDSTGKTWVKTTKGFMEYDRAKGSVIGSTILQEQELKSRGIKINPIPNPNFVERGAYTDSFEGKLRGVISKSGAIERAGRRRYITIGGRRIMAFSDGGQVLPYGTSIKNGILHAAGGWTALPGIMNRKQRAMAMQGEEDLIKGFTMQDMLSGSKIPFIDEKYKAQVEALRKRILPLPHKTFGYRGSSVTPRDIEMYPPGSTIRFDGTKSVSKDPNVAANFASMNEVGGQYRFTSISNSVAERYGVSGIGSSGHGDMTRIARNAQEEQAMLRIQRMENARDYLSDKAYIAMAEKELASAGIDKARRAELERQLKNRRFNISGRADDARNLRNKAAFLKDRESIVWELELAEGLPALSLGDQSRYIKGAGAFNEKELLMTGMEGQVVKYYRDADGRLRGRVRVTNAQRFKNGGVIKLANGGQLSGYGGGDKIPALLEPGEFVINKEAAAANTPLLDAINANMIQTKANGGKILKLSNGTPPKTSLNQKLGGGMGLMMNLMFMPMMIPMMNEMEGFTGTLMKAVMAVQVFTMALQAASMAKGLGTGIMARRAGPGGLGLAPGAGAALRGQGAMTAFRNAKTASSAGAIGSTLSGLGAAASAAAGPLLIVAAAAAVVAAGIYMWRKVLDRNVQGIESMFKASTEMAKVYNIELRKSTKAMAENRKQFESVGGTSPVLGRGAVDAAYAKAVTKEYGSGDGNLIGRLKDMREGGNVAGVRADLSMVYSKLIMQGFSIKQAKEVTAEIARQAGATAQFSEITDQLTDKIKDEDDAMSMMVSQFDALEGTLKTVEERTAAFKGVISNLNVMLSEDPANWAAKFADAVEIHINNTRNLSDAIGDAKKALVDMGYTSGKIYGELNKLQRQYNRGDITKKEAAPRIRQLLTAGALEIPDILVQKMSVKELDAEIGRRVGLLESKKAINEEADARIKASEKAIKGTNEYYDNLIAQEEKAKDKIQKNHDKEMKNLEDKANALNDLKDILSDNADYYIKMLQKEYDAERYYQGQRENALGGLKSLAEGDIFGYLSAQQKMASDAQQFGREEAIRQIEDTRDNALKDLDGQLKANQDAADSLNDRTQGKIDAIDKDIENLNKQRSRAIKALNDYIDKMNKIKETPIGKITAKMLKEMETESTKVGKLLPVEISKTFEKGTSKIVERIGIQTRKSLNALAKEYNISPKKIMSFLEGEIGDGTKVGSEFNQTASGDTGSTNYYEDKPDTAERRLGTNAYRIGRNKKDTGYVIYAWNPDTEKYDVIKDSIEDISLKGNNPFTAFLGKLKGGKGDFIRWKSAIKGFKYLNAGSTSPIPGVGNTDTVPAMLTPGEFVMNKAATSANLPLLQAMNGGAVPGYNSGGMVRRFNSGSMKPVGNFISPNISSPSYSMPSQSEVSVDTATNNFVNTSNTNNITMPVNIVVNGSNLTSDDIIGVVGREMNRQRRSMERSLGI